MNFFCEKNDTSLFVVGSHSKKRPNNLTFIRMFGGQVLDMVEVGIENAKSLNEFKVNLFLKIQVTSKLQTALALMNLLTTHMYAIL